MSALCVMGADCKAFARKTNTPATAAPRNLCAACESHYRRSVKLLVYDFVDLCQFIARRDGHSDIKISRPKPASTPPIDLSVDTLRTDIVSVLGRWEHEVRHAAGLHRRSRDAARDGFNVDIAVRIINPRVDLMAALPAPYPDADTGAEALLRLAELHRRARRATGLSEPAIRLPGECPQCTVASLIRSDGEDTVWCATCNARWEYPMYQRWVSMMISPEDFFTDP